MSENNERSFTQEEVNNIVSDRLKQERTKIMREAQEHEAKLNRREALLAAKADWTKRGLPADLLDTLDLSQEGSIEAAASILERIKPANTEKEAPQKANLPHFTTSIAGGTASKPDVLRNAFGLNRRKDE